MESTPILIALLCPHTSSYPAPSPTILTASNSNVKLSLVPSAKHGHRKPLSSAVGSPFQFTIAVFRWNLSTTRVSPYNSRVDSPTPANLSPAPPQAGLTSWFTEKLKAVGKRPEFAALLSACPVAFCTYFLLSHPIGWMTTSGPHLRLLSPVEHRPLLQFSCSLCQFSPSFQSRYH